MTERIVDEFESVQVEYADRKRAPLVYRETQMFDEQHPIRDSGQRIVRRLALQFEVGIREGFVTFLEQVNGVAQLPPPIVQAHPQRPAEHAQEDASPEGGHEAQPYQAALDR